MSSQIENGMESMKHTAPVGARSRARRTDGGAIINLLSAIIFFGLLALGVLWVIKNVGQAGQQYSTAMIKASNQASALKCEMNMHSIWQCLQAYGMENDALPSSQEKLMRVCGDSRLVRCSEPNAPEYVYVPGQRLDMNPENVVVYEPLPVHQGRSVVLRLDGRTELLEPEALKEALAATASQVRRGR
jgi:hypothetical protein